MGTQENKTRRHRRRGKTNNPNGRPPVYDKKFDQVAESICARLGAVLEDLADAFGVHVGTVSRWIREHESFSKAVTAGRRMFDTERVEAALRDCATGYYVKQEELRYHQGEGKWYTHEIKRWVSPSVQAQRFWLKNRNSREWRDVREEKRTEERLLVLKLEGASEEDLRNMKNNPAQMRSRLKLLQGGQE